MGRYTLRDGEVKAPKMSVKELSVCDEDNEGTYAAPYLKLSPVAASGEVVYLFVGTSGSLCLSSTAPIGTSGAFANKGKVLGTAA